jgi:hypothetical protein
MLPMLSGIVESSNRVYHAPFHTSEKAVYSRIGYSLAETHHL